MFKAYQYVFYRIYIWNRNAWGEQDWPHFNAVWAMAALTLLNIFTLLAALQTITGIKFVTAMKVFSPIELSLMALCYLTIHCYVLLGKKRYKKIIAKYNQKGKEVHKKNTVWVMLYIICTPIALVALGLIGGYLANQ